MKIAKALLGKQSSRAGFISILLLSILSKPLGFLREILVAYFFGATRAVDAFLISLSLYNLTGSLGFVAFKSVGVPALVRKREALSSFASLAVVGGVLLSLFLAVGANLWVELLAPAFTPETRSFAVSLVRLMAPMGLGMFLLAAAVAHFNAQRRFVLTKLPDLLVNACAIGAMLLASGAGVVSLALGWSWGYFLVGTGALWLALKGSSLRLERPFGEDAKQFLKSLAPVFLAHGAYQVNVIVDRAFASSLEAGSVAALSYGWKLAFIPLVLVKALESVQLTRASEMAAVGMLKKLKSDSMKLALVGGSVALAGGLVAFFLAEPLVRLVFERGAFTSRATALTAPAFAFYSLGVAPELAVAVFAAGLWGKGDFKSPAIAAVASVFLNILLNWLLVKPFGIAGLAGASSAAASLKAVLLGAFLWKSR